MRIETLESSRDLDACVEVLRRSFKTVADELGLTPQNAPTNPAFMTLERIQSGIEKGAVFFGAFLDSGMKGCVAVEPSRDDPNTCYIERLAVLPENRHMDLGKALMAHAEGYIKSMGRRIASIGIVDGNTRLKKWYLSLGFKEVKKRKFEHLPFTVCFMEKEVHAQ
jgi:ribosomal protein S18 acetylase RimI-like enzyme